MRPDPTVLLMEEGARAHTRAARARASPHLQRRHLLHRAPLCGGRRLQAVRDAGRLDVGRGDPRRRRDERQERGERRRRERGAGLAVELDLEEDLRRRGGAAGDGRGGTEEVGGWASWRDEGAGRWREGRTDLGREWGGEREGQAEGRGAVSGFGAGGREKGREGGRAGGRKWVKGGVKHIAYCHLGFVLSV